MKVLIVTDAWYPQLNGVVRTYEYLIKELEQKGHDVHVISPADFPMTIPMPGYKEIRLALSPYGHMKKLITAMAPDSIHIATEGPLGWAARNFCVHTGISFTTSYHTHFPDYVAKRLAHYTPFLYGTIHEISKRVVRKFHAPAKVMLIATQSLEDELKAWGFKTPMSRLTRGVNHDLFFPAEDSVFQQLKKPVALYVGRVAIEKNLDAFLAMQWGGSKVVVGSGPSMEDLKARYPGVIFTGKKEGRELAAHYQSADVFVFPSKTDTFGIVLIEALAAGLPIAAYNVTGPKDIITQEFLGALTDNDLAAAAHKALDCGTKQQRSDFIKHHYSWAQAGQQFEAALTLSRRQP
jgi:glycosyltransferase involved in cell wall biosynthesis